MLLPQDVGDGLEHNCFAPVTDEGLAALLGCKLRPHPDKVAEAAALASVRSPNLKYSLCLPKEILLSKPSFLHCRSPICTPGLSGTKSIPMLQR